CSDPNLFAGRQAPPRGISLRSSSKASAMRNVSRHIFTTGRCSRESTYRLKIYFILLRLILTSGKI
ncbi:hypothetical protein, partial [Alkaliphilus transvaalensis]|uniref:hypothetical protein n=1 Tax=Alkaliphilus transvaalensis TaxID=114628 RepID=UPI001A9A3F5E